MRKEVMFGLFLLSLFLCFSFAGAAEYNSTQTTIFECGTITQAGTYTLNQSFSANGTCLTISVNTGVTIEGNGHTLTGNQSGDGIYFYLNENYDGWRNLSFYNITLTNFSKGIYLYYVDWAYESDISGDIHNLNTSSNLNYGIYLEGIGKFDFNIDGVVAERNGNTGFYFKAPSVNNITNSNFSHNLGHGLYYGDRNKNIPAWIINCNFINNSITNMAGLVLNADNERYKYVVNNTFQDNYYGVKLGGDSDLLYTHIAGNTFNNTQNNLYFNYGDGWDQLKNSYIYGNYFYGPGNDLSSFNTISNSFCKGYGNYYAEDFTGTIPDSECGPHPNSDILLDLAGTPNWTFTADSNFIVYNDSALVSRSLYRNSTIFLADDWQESFSISSGGTLDCLGHKITGEGSGTGVTFYGVRGGVRNCTIVNFETGISNPSSAGSCESPLLFEYNNLSNLSSNGIYVGNENPFCRIDIFNNTIRGEVDDAIDLRDVESNSDNANAKNISYNYLEGNVSIRADPNSWDNIRGVLIHDNILNGSSDSINFGGGSGVGYYDIYVWRNIFVRSGIPYDVDNDDYCPSAYGSIGNYYYSTVPSSDRGWNDCGPHPNANLILNQSASENNWSFGASEAMYTTDDEATLNAGREIILSLAKGSGPYSDFYFQKSYISLDCQGEQIIGSGSGNGVSGVSIIHDLEIKNCYISNFSRGISFNRVYGLNLSNTTIRDNDYGYYSATNYDVVINKTIFTNNSDANIRVYDYAGTSNRFTIVNNYFNDSDYLILDPNELRDSKMYSNHIVGNAPNDIGSYYWDVDLNNSDNGNYWTTFDSVSEGCVDNEGDGICDSKYSKRWLRWQSPEDYLPLTSAEIGSDLQDLDLLRTFDSSSNKGGAIVTRQGQAAMFYANYTTEEGVFIDGANCVLTVNGSEYVMDENPDNYSKIVSLAFSDTYTWDVNCSKVGFDTLWEDDIITIYDTSPPQVNFTNSTPSDGAVTNDKIANISVMINEENLQTFIYNWNETNYTLFEGYLMVLANFDNVSVLGENDTLVRDASVNNLTGVVTSASPNSSGRYEGAFEFGPSGESVIFNVTDMNVTSYTVAFWARTDNHSQEEHSSLFSSEGSSATGSFQIDVGGSSAGCDGSYRWLGNPDGSSTAICFGNSSVNEWKYFVVVYNDTHLNAYIDGVLETSTALDYNATLVDARVGVNRGGTKSFDGLIDEFRLYNKSFDSEEISILYKSNLRKINNSYWGFEIMQKKNSTDDLEDGIYYYQSFAGDAFSITSSTEKRTLTVSSDSSGPVVTLNSPITGTSYTGTTDVEFEFSMTDDSDVSSCSVVVGGISYTNSSVNKTSTTVTVSLGVGSYSPYVSCTDTLGYVGNSSSISLTVNAESSGVDEGGTGGGWGGGGGSSEEEKTAEEKEEIAEEKEEENKKNFEEYIQSKITSATERGCEPNFVCSNYGKCSVEATFYGLLKRVSSLEGLQKLFCVDQNNCVASYFNESNCSVEFGVYANKVEICGEGYIEIYEKETDKMVVRLRDKSDLDEPSIDVFFYNSFEDIDCSVEEIREDYSVSWLDKFMKRMEFV